MTTWHTRLQQALTAREKTWQELFDYLAPINKIRKPSVYAWKVDATKRSNMIDGDNLALVCAWLNINPILMMHGQGNSGLEDSEISTLFSMYAGLSSSKQTAVKEMIHTLAAAQEAEIEAQRLKQQVQSLSLKAR